jgi:hypothetical protein
MTNQARRTFRITLWRPWLLGLTPLVLLGGLSMAVSAAQGQFAYAWSILLFLALIAFFLLLPIGLFVWASRWHVDPKGIGGRNNWFVYHHLHWAEID